MKLLGLISAWPLCASAADLGSTLHMDHGSHDYPYRYWERTFTQYKSLPINEGSLIQVHRDIWGTESGWIKHDGGGSIPCDPNIGYAWTFKANLKADPDTLNPKYPLILYTTFAGQLSGVGVVIDGHGHDAFPASQKKWSTDRNQSLVPLPPGFHGGQIDVAFRSGDIICKHGPGGPLLGDKLIVNPQSKDKDSRMELPLTEQGVEAAGWKRGSCFDGMGWHWFLDTSVGQGKLSWSAENLFPVVTMFDKGKINAIFFTSTINQVTTPLIQSNEWEPKSLSPSEMCKNLCDKDCDFKGLGTGGPFSTMHIYFKDHKDVTCPSNLQCFTSFPLPRMSCCEKDVVV